MEDYFLRRKQPLGSGSSRDPVADSLLKVHLTEYSGLRDLVGVQIGQDRHALNLGVTIIGTMLASLSIIAGIKDHPEIQQLLWLIPPTASLLLIVIGFMNARSIQGGLEANLYIIHHLRPAIRDIIKRKTNHDSERVLQSEHFFPKLDLFRDFFKIPETSSTKKFWKFLSNLLPLIEGSVRKGSAYARASIFIIPAGICFLLILMLSLFPQPSLGIELFSNPVEYHQFSLFGIEFSYTVEKGKVFNTIVFFVWVLSFFSLCGAILLARAYSSLNGQLKLFTDLALRKIELEEKNTSSPGSA